MSCPTVPYSFSLLPLWEALPLQGTHVYLRQFHPSLVLRRRLSLLADDEVTVVLVVELRSSVYDVIDQAS